MPSQVQILAVDHLDQDQSVVRSGIALAEIVLNTLESNQAVIVSFDGLKGASSSYFNVFLRRIQEGCGLAELGRHIEVSFSSEIQKMVYERSLDAITSGPRKGHSATESHDVSQRTEVDQRSQKTKSLILNLIKRLRN